MMRILLNWVVATAIGASAVGCGGNDSSPPGDSLDRELDTSDGGSQPDAGGRDASVDNCADPVNGTGCATGQSCVFRPVPTEAVRCQDLGVASALGDMCSLPAPDCPVGATCVISEDGDAPRCRQTCRPAMQDTDCVSLPGDHICITLAQTSGTYGFCLPLTACDPLRPDDCPMMETCTVLSADTLGCAPAGTVPAGGDCRVNACGPGLVCLTLENGGPRCYEPCGDAVACGHASRPNCQALTNRAFGACVEGGPTCDPVVDTCPAGDRCTLVGNGRAECRPAGTVPRGGDCSVQSCRGGNICVDTGTATQCFQPCNAGTTCDDGVCQGTVTGYDFGICVAD